MEEFIDEAEEEDIVNDNIVTHHQLTLYDKLFKYTMCNNITTCSNCDSHIDNIYEHCIECTPFIASIQSSN